MTFEEPDDEAHAAFAYTDAELLAYFKRHPVPACAHPRAVTGAEEKDAMNWVTVPWSCPDCGKSGAQRFHRSR